MLKIFEDESRSVFKNAFRYGGVSFAQMKSDLPCVSSSSLSCDALIGMQNNVKVQKLFTK